MSALSHRQFGLLRLGEAPVPGGRVRLFHHTHSLAARDSILRSGLDPSFSRGELGGVLWASEGGTFSGDAGDGWSRDAKPVFEFHVPEGHVQRRGSGVVTLAHPVPPGDIVHLHDWWHPALRRWVEHPRGVAMALGGTGDDLLRDHPDPESSPDAPYAADAMAVRRIRSVMGRA